MASRLRWVIASLLACAVTGWANSEGVCAKDRQPESGASLQSILELETTARLLAVLLDSGRNVINEHQVLFDEQEKTEKYFTPDVFERQLLDLFRSRSGTDLRDLEAARIPARAKKLLKELVLVSKQVVAEAQPEIHRRGGGPKEFIPAIFGARVATRFTERTHVRLKQTALAPRNPLNAPDTGERAALEAIADPSYPREKVISEVTAKSGSLRLMFPLYTTRKCLDCHGDPKGELDRTGYPREGLKLGQNAGAISVVIPIRP
jgi:general secretion pathway protein A